MARLLGLGQTERAGDGEDSRAVLSREDGSSRVRATITQALDRVEDREVGVAKVEKVRLSNQGFRNRSETIRRAISGLKAGGADTSSTAITRLT